MQVKEDKASTDGENHGDVTKLFYQNSKQGPKQIQVPSPQELQLQIMEVDEEQHTEGYDLDGNVGAYWGTVRKEGQQLYDNNNNNNDDDTVVREKLLVDAPPPPNTSYFSSYSSSTSCYNYNRGYSCGYDY